MKRLVQKFENNGKVAKVYRNRDYEEFEVRFSINGEELSSECDYFTNDKDDALETAEHWVSSK